MSIFDLFIDITHNFKGVKSFNHQALQFPRSELFVDSILLESTTIPKQLKDATCEMALIHLSIDKYSVSTQDDSVKSIKLGSGALGIEFVSSDDDGKGDDIVGSLLRKFTIYRHWSKILR